MALRYLPLNLASQPIEGLTRARRWVMVAAGIAGALTLLQLTFVVQIAADTARPPRVETLSDLPLEEWEREVYLYERVVERISAGELGAAATLADELISWRAFPWARVFSDLEGALPENVRLTRVQPGHGEEGAFSVEITAESRNRNPLNNFFRAVEGLDSVDEVFPVAHNVLQDGREQMTIELRYTQSVEPDGATVASGADVGVGRP